MEMWILNRIMNEGIVLVSQTTNHRWKEIRVDAGDDSLENGNNMASLDIWWEEEFWIWLCIFFDATKIDATTLCWKWEHWLLQIFDGKGILNMTIYDNIFFDVTKIDVITLSWKLGQWMVQIFDGQRNIAYDYDL